MPIEEHFREERSQKNQKTSGKKSIPLVFFNIGLSKVYSLGFSSHQNIQGEWSGVKTAPPGALLGFQLHKEHGAGQEPCQQLRNNESTRIMDID